MNESDGANGDGQKHSQKVDLNVMSFCSWSRLFFFITMWNPFQTKVAHYLSLGTILYVKRYSNFSNIFCVSILFDIFDILDYIVFIFSHVHGFILMWRQCASFRWQKGFHKLPRNKRPTPSPAMCLGCFGDIWMVFW